MATLCFPELVEQDNRELILSTKTPKEDDKDQQNTIKTKGTLMITTQVALPVPAQRREGGKQARLDLPLTSHEGRALQLY